MEEYLSHHADKGLLGCADELETSPSEIFPTWERLELESQKRGKVNAPMRVYVASPFSADTEIEIEANLEFNVDVSYEVFKCGHLPYSPAQSPLTESVQLSQWNEEDDHAYETYVKDFDFKWLEVCDAILLEGRWTKSRGCKMEYEKARELGLWIYFSVSELPEVDRSHYDKESSASVRDEFHMQRKQLLTKE